MEHPKTLGDMIKTHQSASLTPESDALSFKWEDTYLEQGGALTLEQRDKAYSEAMELARKFEKRLAIVEAGMSFVMQGQK